MEWNHRKEFCLPLTFIPLSIKYGCYTTCLIQKWRNLNFSRDFSVSTAKNYIIFLQKIMFSGIGFTILSLSQIWLFVTIGASSHSELTTKLQRTLWSQLCAIYEWCYIWIDILRKFSRDFLRTLQRVSGSTTTQNGLIHFKGL